MVGMAQTPGGAGVVRKTLETRADWWARLTALVVLIAGLAVIVAPTLLHIDEVWENPFVPAQTKVEEITIRPDGTTIEKTTTSEAERSFAERSLASGGLLLLRLGAVAVAAFLAGAVVQRAILGRFDVKLGPFELPEAKQTAEASEAALAAVQEELGRQVQATDGAMRLAAGTADALAALHAETADLRGQVSELLTLLGAGSATPEGGEEGSQVEEGLAREADVDVQLEETQEEENE
jgi:hypothetical protein